MKAFLTGATGFLGRNLVELLQAKGWELHAYVRESSDTSGLKNINFIRGDLFHEADKLLPKNLDALFHIAGDTNQWYKNNQRQYRVNVDLTKSLVHAAIKNQTQKFILTSSVAAFGMHDSKITEKTPSNALSKGTNYHRTKFLGQQEVLKRSQDIHTVVLNPCSIMGKYDKQNWSQLFTLLQQDALPGIPNASSSYCYVGEVAKAHLSAFEKAASGEKFILGGPEHSFTEVIQRVQNLLGKDKSIPVLPRPLLLTLGFLQETLSRLTQKEPDLTLAKAKLITNRATGDSSKAVKELGYNDSVPLETMLQECFEWLKQENLLQ